jgi:alpha-ketoglutarate-dependent taurine dioxygenase
MITVKKLTASIGAEIGGVDLSQPLSPETVAGIKQAY